jgi:hypothetical protein
MTESKNGCKTSLEFFTCHSRAEAIQGAEMIYLFLRFKKADIKPGIKERI